MKFIKPSEWVTPEKNRESLFGDCYPTGVHLITFFQRVTYPVAAVVSGIGSVITKNKE